jgi:hypothetical protein
MREPAPAVTEQNTELRKEERREFILEESTA